MKLFDKSDNRYIQQLNLIRNLASTMGFVVYLPDYHAKDNDKCTILLYTKQAHSHNIEVDKQFTHYSSADEAAMYGCTDDRYYYHPYFFCIQNTDINGQFDFNFANHGKIDLRKDYEPLKNAIYEAFAAAVK